MKINPFYALGLCLLAASCSHKSEEGSGTVRFVRDVLSNRSSREAVIVTGARPKPEGDVYVIGTDASCLKVSESLFSYDRHDNVDGRIVRDYLPDFAGERICCVVDRAIRGYSDYLGDGGRDALREIVVRRVIDALDTLGYLSVFDTEGRSHRNGAKVVVLADSYLAQVSKPDIDTLFNVLGCSVPILSSSIAVKDALAGYDPSRVGIMCSRESLESGVFDGYGFAACVDGSEEPLREFLDTCAAAGRVEPFDAIVVDGLNVSLDTVQSELSVMCSVMDKASMIYGKWFSDSFKLFNSLEVLAERCYSLLREGNLFTHNISRPTLCLYAVLPRPDSETECLFVEGGLESLGAGFFEEMASVTPKLYSAYVQE